MRSSAPFGQRLLRHFFMSDDLEEEVLGDLHEELDLRRHDAGLGPANLWYFGQAASVIPHLLRSWIRDAGRFQIMKSAGVVTTLFLVVAFASAFAHGTALAVVNIGLSMMSTSSAGPSSDPLVVNWVGIAMSVSAISALFAIGGGIAGAALGGRAPMVPVVWLGLFWSVTAPLYVLTSLPEQWPSLYVMTYPLSMVGATLTGGYIGATLRAYLAARRSRLG